MAKGKLLILVGISGSGKSTFAHNLWKDAPNNTTIVNRDKIRELLFGYTEAGIQDYYLRNDISTQEKKVTRYEDTLINEALEKGNLVIVDATHLTRKYIERFKYWNVPTEVKFFDISIGQAVFRDDQRNRKVGTHIIGKQHAKYVSLINSLDKNPIDFTPFELDNDDDPEVGRQHCVVVDIDGTLAEKGDRSPYDWQNVHMDTVIKPVRDIVEDIYDKVKVIIATGRDGECLALTEMWLEKHGIPYDEIYIRERGDMRADWIVKREMAEKICKNHYISCWIDDRLQVTRYLRNIGIKVLNVEYNNF